ncbi:MAG: hypothetical protein WC907_01520 [Acholeplasmataceae bacterium]
MNDSVKTTDELSRLQTENEKFKKRLAGAWKFVLKRDLSPQPECCVWYDDETKWILPDVVKRCFGVDIKPGQTITLLVIPVEEGST